VGIGTFRPVRAARVEAHRMHAEEAAISAETAGAINRAHAEARRVVAVGTTTTRALEWAAGPSGQVRAARGAADLFIYPGHRFRAVDALITNFHLPRSTLLMLVAGFAGREFVLDAYRYAAAAGYRFYSYGDAMLIE
jgi:S-adenosylmethionine:tRNA ribosyltransferase-isomerase